MNSTRISDPLKLLDCCLVTDGAGAVVMTTADNAKAHGAKSIAVRGYGEAHTHWSIGAMPDLARLTAAEMSSQRAFEMAGVSRDAIDLVECYDSFTITVLLTLEALGFCKRGEGGQFVMNQRTAPGGDFPLNNERGRAVVLPSGHVRHLPAGRGGAPAARRGGPTGRSQKVPTPRSSTARAGRCRPARP